MLKNELITIQDIDHIELDCCSESQAISVIQERFKQMKEMYPNGEDFIIVEDYDDADDSFLCVQCKVLETEKELKKKSEGIIHE